MISAGAQQLRDPESEKTSQLVCHRDEAPRALPASLRETSGLAASLLQDDLFWTHNDRGNPPILFAVNTAGEVLRSIELDVPAEDWEDIEISDCDKGPCIFVADTGDNDGEREHVTVYRLAEPGPNTDEAGPVEALHARFPDGPRDVEALFVLPGGSLFLVSKGRREDIALYQYPEPMRPDSTVVLERVRQLFPEPEDSDDRVTAATASRDGRLVGIRTSRSLYIYSAERLRSGDRVDPIVVSLESLAERQGEGLAMPGDGTVWLSSEADGRNSVAVLNRLICDWSAD